MAKKPPRLVITARRPRPARGQPPRPRPAEPRGTDSPARHDSGARPSGRQDRPVGQEGHPSRGRPARRPNSPP